MNGKANSGHTHDDRYYTEFEINSKFNTVNTTFGNKYKFESEFSPFSGTDPYASFNISIYKIYKMCFITIKWVGGTNLKEATFSEVTIPSAFRPIKTEYFTTQHISSNMLYSSTTRFDITAAGQIHFITDSMERYERCVSTAYISNNETPSSSYLVN